MSLAINLLPLYAVMAWIGTALPRAVWDDLCSTWSEITFVVWLISLLTNTLTSHLISVAECKTNLPTTLWPYILFTSTACTLIGLWLSIFTILVWCLQALLSSVRSSDISWRESSAQTPSTSTLTSGCLWISTALQCGEYWVRNSSVHTLAISNFYVQRWRQRIAIKCQSVCTKIHGVTFHKTAIFMFTAVMTLNLAL